MTTPSGHTSAIRGKKVIGTTVKDMAGTTIGEVEDVVLDKESSKIMFAVISFGGFLGIGEKYHPIPWSALNYVPDEDAYMVKYTKDQLEAAPHDTIEELTRDNGVSYRDRSYDYYGVARDWQ
ncbi:MAG TPA: PRC-barrel domain-containing protein [Alphaproteobacteria bacterium]|jgi:sporulation protein YlmC with PRC-barrel domain|nr:PRC-barrel domain-containing protein [Alphaproteobacteria bacterium]